MVNLLGCGFIGNHYRNLTPCLVNERNNLIPQIEQGDILYMISTTDNYNLAINPYIDIDTNLTTLIRVLENCRGRDIVFNFVSSWFVYGDVATPYQETSLCNPRGFYSVTKRTAEQLMMEYCNYHRIPWRIMRLANVVGPGDRGASPKKNILTHMIRRLQRGEVVELHSRGQQSRDYINVHDVVHAIDLILKSGNVNDIYNVGNGVSTTLAQAIEYAADQMSVKHLIRYCDGNNSSTMSLNVDKLWNLGYRPKYSVFSSIDQLIAENT